MESNEWNRFLLHILQMVSVPPSPPHNMDAKEYLKKSTGMDNCGSKLVDSNFFLKDDRQSNALIVEVLRDISDYRCGLKPPAEWYDDAKRRGGEVVDIFGWVCICIRALYLQLKNQSNDLLD